MAKDPPPSQIQHFKFVAPPKKKKKKKPNPDNKEGGEQQTDEKAPTPKQEEEEDEEWKKERERREESLRRAKIWEEKRKAEKKGLKPTGRGRGRGRGRGGPRRSSLGTGRRSVRKVGALDEIPEANETDDANRKSVLNNGKRPTTKQTLRPPTNQSTRPITSQSKRSITSQSKRPLTNQSKREPSRISNRPPTVKSDRPETSKSLRPATHQSQRPVTAAKEAKEEREISKEDTEEIDEEDKKVIEESPIVDVPNEKPKEEPQEIPKEELREVPKEEPPEVDQVKEKQKQTEEKNDEEKQDEGAAKKPPDSLPRRLSVFGKVGLFSKKLFKKVEERKKAEEENKKADEEKEEEKKEDEKSEEDEGKVDDEGEENGKDNEVVAEEDKVAEDIPTTEEEPIQDEQAADKTENEEVEPEPETEIQNEKEEEKKENKGLFGFLRRKSNTDDAISMKTVSQSRVSLLGRSRANLQTVDRAPSVISKHSVACSPFVFDETSKVEEAPKDEVIPIPKTDVKEEKDGLGWNKLKTTLFGSKNSTTLKTEVKEAALQRDLTEPPNNDTEQTTELNKGTSESSQVNEKVAEDTAEGGDKNQDPKEESTTEGTSQKGEGKMGNRPVIIINTTPNDASFQSTLIKALSGEGPSDETSENSPQGAQQIPLQMPMGMPVMNPMMNPMMINPMLNPMVNPYMSPYYPQQGFYPQMIPQMVPGAMNPFPPGTYPPGYGYQMQPPQPQFFYSQTREKPAPSINDTVIVSKKKTRDKSSSNRLSGGALANFAQKYPAAEVQERVRRKIEEGEKEAQEKDLTDEWFERSDSDDDFYKSEKRKLRRGRRRDMLYQQEKAEKKRVIDEEQKIEAKKEEEKEKEKKQFEKKMQGLLSLIETGEEVQLAKTPEVNDEELEKKLTQEREEILKNSLKNDVPDMDLESFLKETEDKPKDDEFAKMLATLNAEAASKRGAKNKNGEDNKRGDVLNESGVERNVVQEKKKTAKKNHKLDDAVNNLLQAFSKPAKQNKGVRGNRENGEIEKSEKEEMEKELLTQKGETNGLDLFVKQGFTEKSLQNLKTSNSIHVSPISSREASGELQVVAPSKREPSYLPSIQVGPGRKMTPEELLYNAQKQLFEAQQILSPSNAPT